MELRRIALTKRCCIAGAGRTADVILCTLGTRGDIEPFAMLAKRLVTSGLYVDILSNENWRELSEDTGASFYPIAPPDPSQSGRDDIRFFRRNIVPSFSESFRHVEKTVEAGRQPILVYKLNMLGLECAASRFGLRSVGIALQPSTIPSLIRPPWPLVTLVEGPWAPVGRRLALPLIYGLGMLFSPHRRLTARFRRMVGVPSRLFGNKTEPDLVAVLCPSWFALPQADWPQSSLCVGFPFGSGNENLECTRFIGDGSRPIVFTPGTGVTDVDGFAQMAVEVARRTSHRAILLSPHISQRYAAADVIVQPFVDMSWLLPKCRAIVHHGGIGTLAQAVRAGIPQLIVAGRFDQPDNAFRVAQLGLGGAVLRDDPSLSDLTDALMSVLRSQHVTHQVRAAAQLISDEDPFEVIAGTILTFKQRMT